MIADPGFIPVRTSFPYSFEAGNIPPTTFLFREPDIFPVIDLLRHRNLKNEDEPYTILFAGCSTGAEVDSVTSIFEALGKSMKGIGIDRNPEAIACANLGRQVVRGRWQGDETVKALGKLGFMVTDKEDTELLDHFPDYEPGQDLVVDCRDLRAKHDITFEQRSLTKPLERDSQVDLVMARNVMYYFTPDEARRALDNIHATLSPYGMVSFGEEFLATNHVAESDLLGYITGGLELEPVYEGSRGLPTVFAKPLA